MAGVRKIDYEDAAARFAAGETYREIARVYGVTRAGVRLAINAKARADATARGSAWQASGTCPICGSPSTRRSFGSLRCVACAGEARATSVRPDTLQCHVCREWKPDEAFPRNRLEKGARRGRHTACRGCQTEQKRAYRELHRAPCSHGCGRLVHTVDRRDREKPLECRSCAMRRIQAERRAANSVR